MRVPSYAGVREKEGFGEKVTDFLSIFTTRVQTLSRICSPATTTRGVNYAEILEKS